MVLGTLLPSGGAYTAYDLFDKVTKTVIADLTAGIPFFNTVLVGNGFYTEAEIISSDKPGGVRGVFRGEDTRVGLPMFIRVIQRTKEPTWHATQVREDNFTFDVDCLIKNTAEKEITDEEISVLGHAVQNYLIRFENLQPIILGTSPKIRGFDSWADIAEFNNLELKGTYRSARISYNIKVLNSYVGFTGLRCD